MGDEQLRLALALMYTNELPWLKLHLPAYRDGFDGIVAITDPLTIDGSTHYLSKLGADTMTAGWNYNWGAFATKLVNFAEELGYDAVMRVDPDEMLMPGSADEIKRLLTEEAALLCFPRHEFFGDREHVRADIYPDYQARAWRLNRGIVVGGQRHEGINFMQHGLAEHTDDPANKVLRLKDIHIFHYGWASKTGIWENMVKYQSHEQVMAGGPPEVNFPPDTPLVEFPTMPFFDDQPIDPKVCGLFAPFDGVDQNVL
jgi:hypothetical protein